MDELSKFVPAVLDREIRSEKDDAFGHRHFALMLQGLIESDRYKPPYSVGLLGNWGAGKSSIKEMYLNELNDETKPKSNTRLRSERIVPITFNAWRFGGEDIKRALLRHVYLELGGSKEKLDDALFRHVHRPTMEKKGRKEFWLDVLEAWGWSLVQAIIVLFVFVGAVWWIGKSLELNDQQVIGWLTGASVVCSAVVIRFLLSADRFPRRSSVTRVEAPASAAEIYEDLLLGQLALFKQGRTDLKSGKHSERIVIFVDDLDRLSPEEMISGLDAVRTFMELPKTKLPENLGVVFVISCDEDRIAEALADRRRRSNNPDLPGAVFSQTDAHRFLDRIFQFRMEIPPFPKRDMRNYAQKAMDDTLPTLTDEVKASDTTLENLIDRMIHVGVGTPRNALQIVNCFVQSWWIAKKRELDGAGSERAGGLQSGAVTSNPIALGAVCALRVDFPDFYRDLQIEPALIQHFSDVFVRHKPLEDQPETIQSILLRYSADNKCSDVHADHRPLRQFISSIQGVRWPKTLRPLLFLTQDPVTRKYGDRWVVLYEALLSGDVRGVLEQLGREHDKKQFSDGDMRLLHDMVEDLNSETEGKCNDAAFVLASLTDRFPRSTAHLLLTPLARRLAESPMLRWRLGVKNIESVIASATSADRRAVVSHLVADLLKADGEIEFKLTSLEPPSLDEALEMADDACSLALSVHKDDGLDEQTEARLLNWLDERNVSVQSGSQILSFERLEEWIGEHEERLLPLLQGKYPKLIAQEITSGRTEHLNSSEVLRRTKIVFDRLLESGEESRDELWQHVTQYIEHGDAEFVTFASDYVLACVSGSSRPIPDALAGLLNAFGSRLQSPPTDLNIEERADCFVQIVVARQDDLNEEVRDILATLATEWGEDDSLAQRAVRLMKPLCNRFPDAATPILNNWTGRVLTDLPNPCVAWLAESFEEILEANQQARLVKQLDVIHQGDNISDDQSLHYLHFMRSAPDLTLASDRIQSHLQSIFSQIAQRHANPNGYLYQVFPVVPLSLEHVPGSVVASTLQGVFPNTKGQPALFAWLHGEMAGTWPHPTEQMSGYDPDQLFEEAVVVIESYPAEDDMLGALRSVSDMVKRSVVSLEKSESVVDAACQLWAYHPDDAARVLAEHKAVPDAVSVARMIDGISGSEESEFDAIRSAWSVIAERCSVEQQVHVATSLLNEAAKGTENEPDLCLDVWLEVTGENKRQVIEELLSNDDLNDEQHKRVWLHVEKTGELPKEFYLTAIPLVAARESDSATITEVLDSKEEVNLHFTTQQSRFDLGTQLVVAFRISSSTESKARLASWIKDLNVETVLSQLAGGEKLSSDEVELLRPHFEKARSWKKIEKNVVVDQNDDL